MSLDLQALRDRVQALQQEIQESLQQVKTLDDLEALRIRYLGRKGEVTALLKSIGRLPQEARPAAGAEINRLKQWIQQEIQAARERLEREAQERIDLTLPGRPVEPGRLHPITRVFTEIIEIFKGLGFEVEEGPDVEWDYYNFEALNIPPHHPAREMQSTFFITDKMLLRTHTSPIQIRVMERKKPPLRFVAPGRVYRVDPFDPSHAPAFHQLEGLYVDRRVTFAELKGTLELFLREFFGPDTEIKFLPSYFPFTEPSAEVAIRWKGEWLEVLGCGMVNPNVFRAVGIDPEAWKGYAFGLGVERLAMVRYGIPDIRWFSENDLRFLRGYEP